MKFGKAYQRYLTESGLDKSSHVAFKPLKKILKRCGRIKLVKLDKVVCHQHPGSSQETDGSRCLDCEDLFFEVLVANMRAVLGSFEIWASTLLNERVSFKSFLSVFKFVGNGGQVAASGRKLLEFAAINHMAFLKILKKYKKVHGHSPESELALLCLHRRLVLSPHLLEISAMEKNIGIDIKPHLVTSAQTPTSVPVLARQSTMQPASLLHRDQEEAEGMAESWTSPRRMLEQAFGEDSKSGDDGTHVCGLRVHVDATCPICLEKFFKPVALACGHVFCQMCACEAAGVPLGFGLRHAPKTKKCPICRQPGVYCAAMELKEVAKMLKHADREYWSLRKKEASKESRRQLSDYWQIAAGPP